MFLLCDIIDEVSYNTNDILIYYFIISFLFVALIFFFGTYDGKRSRKLTIQSRGFYIR